MKDQVYFNAALALLFSDALILFVLFRSPEKFKKIHEFSVKVLGVEKEKIEPYTHVPLQQALYTIVLMNTIIISSWQTYYQALTQYGSALLATEAIAILLVFVIILKNTPLRHRRQMLGPVVALGGSLIAGVSLPLMWALLSQGTDRALNYMEALSSSSVFNPLVVLFLGISWIFSIAISVSLIAETPGETAFRGTLGQSEETGKLRHAELSVKEAGQ
jgi:hypothetical protein